MRTKRIRLIALSLAAASASPAFAQSPFTVPFDAVSSTAVDAAEEQVALHDDGADRMTVDVHIGGSGPYKFMVDTGADRTAISRDLATRLGLEAADEAKMHSVVSARNVTTASLNNLEFSRKKISGIKAAVLEGRHLSADGLLGIDSLRSESVTFDFKNKLMAIVPSKVENGRPLEHEIVVRGKLRAGRLLLTDADAGNRPISVVVDTGSQATIGNSALRRTLSETGTLRFLGRANLTSVTGETITGDMMAIEQFRIGGVVIEQLDIVFVDAHIFRALGLHRRPAMLLGMNALRAFDRVSIDFANRKFRVVMPVRNARPKARLTSL